MKNPVRENIFHFLLLCVAVLIAFGPVAFCIRCFGGDMMNYFFPMRHFIGQSIQHGTIPLWNPYVNLGFPMQADPQSGFWYAPVWIIGLVNGYSLSGLHFEFIFHLIIAGWGMRALAISLGIERRIALAAGIVFALNGTFISNAQHLSWVIGEAWLPWLICYFRKIILTNQLKNIFASSFIFWLMVTGAYPGLTLISIYGLGFYTVLVCMRKIFSKQHFEKLKAIRSLLIFALASILLCLPYIFSFLQNWSFVSRDSAEVTNRLQVLCFPWKALISFVFPLATASDPGYFRSDITMLNIYGGLFLVLGVSIILLGRFRFRFVFMLAVSLVLLLISIADVLPFFNWIKNGFPLMHSLRFAALFRIPALMLFILLAAFGWHELSKDFSKVKQKFTLGLSVLSVLILSLFFISLTKVGWRGFPADLTVPGMQKYFSMSDPAGNIVLQSLILIPFLLILFFLLLKKTSSAKSKFNFLLAVVCVEMILTACLQFPATVPAPDHFSDLNAAVKKLPQQASIPDNSVLLINTYPVEESSLSPIWNNQDLLAHRIQQFGYNPFYPLLLDNLDMSGGRDSALNHPLAWLEEGTVTIKNYSPNEIQCSTQSSSENYFHFIQNYFPGWKAFVNSAEVQIERHDFTFMKIKIPKGVAQIRLQYSPEYLLATTIISLLTLLLISAFFVLNYFRNKKRISESM